MDASSVETMAQSMKMIAEDPVAKAAGVGSSLRSVLQWLSRTDHEWLLIFDNADGHAHTITKFLPPANRGNILITSRNPMMAHHVSSPKARVEVDVMDKDDSVSLLLKSALLEDSSDDLSVLLPARAIVKELHCLPLAVDQAGAAVACGLCNIQEYLDLYSVRRRELMMLSSFEGASGYGQVVFTTWELSYRAISNGTYEGSDAMAPKHSIFLLELFSFFHNEKILEEAFRRAAEAPVQPLIQPKFTILGYIRNTIQWFSHRQSTEPVLRDIVPPTLLQLDASGKWDPFPFREGIQLLNSFSLIKIDASGCSYSIHPLVHSWSRDRMTEEDRMARCRSACALLAHSINWEYLAADVAFRRDLIPHIKSCTLQFNGAVGPEIYMEKALVNFGSAYHENGYAKEAGAMREKAMQIAVETHGRDHPTTLTAMHYLALTYSTQGRHEEAIELLLRVVPSRTKMLGEEHLNTLQSTSNLAWTYWKQGRYEEAEELQIRVLKARMKVLGPEHSDTHTSINNLAMTYIDLGRYDEAEDLQKLVFESRKRTLGEEHPDTIKSKHNLASAYRGQGRYQEAENLYFEALESRKKVLGEEHPDTLVSRHFIASTFQCQGRYREAEELELCVLGLREKVLGEEHPDTLSSMANLAIARKGLGRDQDAEELMRRTVDLSVKVLGSNHPRTVKCVGYLEVWREQSGGKN